MKNHFNNDVQCNQEWDTSTNTDTKYCLQYTVKLKRQTEEQYVQYAYLYEEDIGKYICIKIL